MAEGGEQVLLLEKASQNLERARKAKKLLDPKGEVFPSRIEGNLIGNRVSSGKC